MFIIKTNELFLTYALNSFLIHNVIQQVPWVGTKATIILEQEANNQLVHQKMPTVDKSLNWLQSKQT